VTTSRVSTADGNHLNELITGEDPHDKAIELLERERQLREYNEVLAASYRRRETQVKDLMKFWCKNAHWYCGLRRFPPREANWLRNTLLYVPAEVIRRAMEIAIAKGATDNFAYVNACLRNWKERGELTEGKHSVGTTG